MTTQHTASGRPKIAIVDSNTLAALGLKQLLQHVMPIMTVDIFGSFAELEANGTIGINVDGNALTIEAEDVEIISEDVHDNKIHDEFRLFVMLQLV